MIEKLLEELIEEHQQYNKQMKQFLKDLEDNFSLEKVEEIINFLEKDIEDHAKKEEDVLIPEVLKFDKDYDDEAIIFGHNTIREATQDVIDTFEDFKKGKATKEDILKFTKKAFNIVKDHFAEEENFLFPNIRKSEKEWL